jgi:hypothetical protein
MPYKDPEKRRECHRKANKVYYEKNREQIRTRAREEGGVYREYQREYQREYRQANKESHKELCKKWVTNNRERMREILRRSSAKGREACSDTYVKGRLIKGSSLKFADIPQGLVEVKRLQLLIKRELKKGKRHAVQRS